MMDFAKIVYSVLWLLSILAFSAIQILTAYLQGLPLECLGPHTPYIAMRKSASSDPGFFDSARLYGERTGVVAFQVTNRRTSR